MRCLANLRAVFPLEAAHRYCIFRARPEAVYEIVETLEGGSKVGVSSGLSRVDFMASIDLESELKLTACL